jgi:hypothetical protein
MADALPLSVRRIDLEGLLPDVLIASATPLIPGAEVVARWPNLEVSGAGRSSRASTATQIADLPSALDSTSGHPIGLAAAVRGWFLVPTPASPEFFIPDDPVEKNRLRLLTVHSPLDRPRAQLPVVPLTGTWGESSPGEPRAYVVGAVLDRQLGLSILGEAVALLSEATDTQHPPR